MRKESCFMKKNAFTLIELLVVILIIGILFGFITAAVRKSLHYAEERRTASDKKTLASAFQAYRHEYGSWPLATGDMTLKTGVRSYQGVNTKQVIKTLQDNERGIRFINIKDYMINPTNDVILNPSSGEAFSYTFNLDDDSCSVD